MRWDECVWDELKLIGIDLSRQTNATISQQTNFMGKFEEGDGAMFFIAEKQQKTILNFSWYIYIYIYIYTLFYYMKQAILNLQPENGPFSMINQMQIMM